MEHDVQGMLLGALEEKSIQRKGGIKDIPIDIRVIAATNLDINQVIKDNSFRKDLYHRISGHPIHLPSLSGLPG